MKLTILEQIGHNRVSFYRISTLHLVARIRYPERRVVARANHRPAAPGSLTLPPPRDGFSSPRRQLPLAYILLKEYSFSDFLQVRGCACRQRGAGSEGRGHGEDKAAEGEPPRAAPCGAGSIRSRRQHLEQPAPTSPPHPQVAEELSQCSHNIFDFQGALDGILSELVKHRQQVHEDKRFVAPALPKSLPTLCCSQLD